MTWRFPSLQARNLEGALFDLPESFAGDPSIVIVAFERYQQHEVDTWLPWLDELRARVPALEVYELPAIKRRWLPARSFIDGGMRAGLPDLETRRRTLTAYTDTGARMSPPVSSGPRPRLAARRKGDGPVRDRDRVDASAR